jgi:hypothetical protein
MIHTHVLNQGGECEVRVDRPDVVPRFDQMGCERGEQVRRLLPPWSFVGEGRHE